MILDGLSAALAAARDDALSEHDFENAAAMRELEHHLLDLLGRMRDLLVGGEEEPGAPG